MYWSQLKLHDVGDGQGHLGHQHPPSFYISVGHQHTKDVANIEILSPTSQKFVNKSFSALSLLFSTCQGFFDAIVDVVDTLEGVDMSRSYCKCGEKRPWSDWGNCSKSCGTGEQTKTRVCYRRGSHHCRFHTEREYTWRQKCNTHACRKSKITFLIG